MAITRYNSVQFSEVSNNQLAGVALVYRSVRKDGTVVESCIHLGGADFVPANGTEDEIFRVWKNALKLHWEAKREESALKVDNGGIAVKLRASTPAEIVVRKADGRTALRWTGEDSIFARVGIMPTAKDLQELARDYKKKMHKAAQASFKALKLKFKFDAAETVEQPAQNMRVTPTDEEREAYATQKSAGVVADSFGNLLCMAEEYRRLAEKSDSAKVASELNAKADKCLETARKMAA